MGRAHAKGRQFSGKSAPVVYKSAGAEEPREKGAARSTPPRTETHVLVAVVQGENVDFLIYFLAKFTKHHTTL